MRSSSPTPVKVSSRGNEWISQEEKAERKRALQADLGWPEEPRRALLAIPAGVSDRLGGRLLMDVIPGLLELPVSILILGKGSASYGQALLALGKEHRHRLAIIPNGTENVDAMLAAADMALFSTDPADLPELAACIRSGAVPVAPASEALENYNPNQESGTAFLYEKENPWHCFAAVVRALETYRFPFDWRTIQKNGSEVIQ